MIVSYSTSQANERWIQWLDGWANTNLIVYAVLKENTDPARAQESMNAVLSANLGDESDTRRAYLQPITDIHLGSGAIQVERHAREGDPRYIYIFSAIGMFLVLIASINYMNMTTARSMRRAREIGMRKVTGGHKGQLVRQFLAESILTTVLAIVIAVTLVTATLPFFNDIAGKDLSSSSLMEWRFLLELAALALLVGLFAGSYPALFLSRLSPSQILSGSSEVGAGATRLRRGLVVAQFTLSIFMIVATIVVYNQMDFVQSTRLGFNENQLVVVDINNGDVRRDWETVRAEFSKVPFVESVSTSSRVPGDWKDMTEIEVRVAGESSDDLVTMHFLGVDDAFLKTFEIELLSGRDFSPDRADSTSVIVNESAARLLGITSPANQMVEIPSVPFLGQVVGIVEDFNYESLHRPVGPLILGYWSNPVRAIDYFTARIRAGRLEPVIAGLREVGERFDPSHPFEYNVLDQRLRDFYVADRRMGTLFGLAAALAIFIACLGLAGLAAYTAERRTKEIGVRKVLGASVQGIVVLLSRDFVILVLVAFVIAGPLSYLAMDRWLNAFAYKTDLSLSIFVLSGAAALALALVTVSFQAIRSAVSNPIESLRYE
jgi:putative ABC transport system permease protein